MDSTLGGREQLSGNLEAYKATIDMQAMIALYTKQNIQRLQTERAEDPQHGPSAGMTNTTELSVSVSADARLAML